MDILRDLKELMYDDREHHLKVEVSYEGVKIYLDYDPNQEHRKACIIPIFYEASEDLIYSR